MADNLNPDFDKINDLSKIVLKVTQELLDAKDIMKELVSSSNMSAGTAEMIRERITEQKNAMKELLDITAKQGTQYIKQETLTRRLEESDQRRKAIDEQILSITEKLNTAREKSGSIETELTNSLSAQLDILTKQIEAENLVDKGLKTVVNNLRMSNKEALDLQNKIGLVGQLFQKIAKIGPFKFSENIMDTITDAAKKKGATATSVMKAGIGALGEELKNISKDPAAKLILSFYALGKIISIANDLLKEGFKAILEMSKGVTQIGNNMGLSKKSAQGLYDVFSDISEEGKKINQSLDTSFLSITNQIGALSSLQESFGTSAMFSDEMLQNHILLTKQMGLEADEAAGIQRLGMLNKQSAESILNTAVKSNNANISYRKIISEIGKINAEISAAYKNNPDLIAKAVVQAAKLGMTMEQARKVADSLLDFESSISNELEAELLTGKQLNFEKARALALDGKSSEAAAELMKQMGGLEGLTKMNVITRNAMAKSIGMTSEELMKSVQQQEILNALGADNQAQLQNRYDKLIAMGETSKAQAMLDDIRKQKNGEMLAQDISKASLAARMEESMNRLKEIFVSTAAGPLTSMLETFAGLLKHTTLIKGLLIGLGVAMGVIALAAGIYASNMAKAAISATIATGGANLAGAAIATAVVGGVIAAALLNPVSEPVEPVHDSQISPSGQIMIKTPKGMIKPDPKDSIITTTEPDKLLGRNDKAGELNTLPTAKSVVASPVASPISPESAISKTEASGVNKTVENNTEKTVNNNTKEVDTSGIENRLDKMLSALSKGGHVYIDSVRSGTAYGMSYNSYA